MAEGRRFAVSSAHLTIFVDCLRLARWDDLGRSFLTVGADDPETIDSLGQPVIFDIPKNAGDAYRRAAEAFNAVMDEHERQHEQRLVRRRGARQLRSSEGAAA